MEYQGLTTDDLANVRALNRAWLELPAPRAQGATVLSSERQERLAQAPFLLFSFREQDTVLWRGLHCDGEQRDLFHQRARASERLGGLQAAGLAFLWSLTRRNPYAARVISGAPLPWCEQIAAATLLQVHEFARSCDLLVWRFPDDSPISERLCADGTSASRRSRLAAQLSALQALLTISPTAHRGRLQAAACRMQDAGRRMIDEV